MSDAAADAFIREIFGLQGAAYLVVGLRYYSQFSKFGRRGLAWDDLLMLIATVITPYIYSPLDLNSPADLSAKRSVFSTVTELTRCPGCVHGRDGMRIRSRSEMERIIQQRHDDGAATRLEPR